MRIKICGVRSAADIAACATAGADYLGFNFFPKSPRYVAPGDVADLAAGAPADVVRVGLAVDPDDDLIAALMRAPLGMLQLHGAESPERVAALRARTGLPVMKALGVADAGDLPKIAEYEQVADQILVDAKPPKDGVLPGGNGLTFDWRLIAGRNWVRPWMLAGGLTALNVAEAIRLTGTEQVDVSSGVERAPGEKSPDKVAAFCAAARAD